MITRDINRDIVRWSKEISYPNVLNIVISSLRQAL